MTQPVIIIVGPTASGKSAIAERLARERNGEIISADSAQVYIGMDKGTAKPDAQTRTEIRHHLIDLITPTQQYNAQQFAKDAVAAVGDIQARGKLAIICGGTMLYIRALIYGFDELPETDGITREAIALDGENLGWPAIHAQLAAVDPVTAARLSPNDKQRISRALEVHAATGKPISSLQRGDGKPLLDVPYELYALMPSEPVQRATLHERIAFRFNAMVASGLLEEVRALQQQYGERLTADNPAMRCVGYRQAWEYLAGLCSHDEFIERGIAATRQLAKRQMTWIRGMDVRDAGVL
jgi:tRNA dimethylallyltransferase